MNAAIPKGKACPQDSFVDGSGQFSKYLIIKLHYMLYVWLYCIQEIFQGNLSWFL